MTFAPCGLPPLNNRSTIWFDARFKFARNAFQENALCAIIEEAHMPLSPEQEALCERLEKGESTPTAATLILIYATRGGPDNLRWFWSMTTTGPMALSDRMATLEEAKAQFRKVGRLESLGEAE
jgi:hypothetical protein